MFLSPLFFTKSFFVINILINRIQVSVKSVVDENAIEDSP